MDGKSKTGYVILGLLSDRSALSGYDIKKLIERRFGFFWSESYGQIYPELKRLLAAKLVKAAPDRSAFQKKGGKKRKVFSITSAGKMALFDWLALPPEKESVRIEFLLKLCFGSLRYKDDILSNIRAFRFRSEENLASLRALERELKGALENAQAGGDAACENDPYVLIMALFARRVCEAHLKWCSEAESMLLGR